MNSRGDAVNPRAARARSNRRILLAGIAVSVGLHGWAFAALTVTPADLSRTVGVPQRAPVPSEFEFSAIEVVRVTPEPEEVEPLPIPTDDRPVVAAAAPERNPESAARTAEAGSQVAVADGGSPGIPGSAPAASYGDAGLAAESAPPPTFAELLESAMGSRPAVAMTPRFAAQQPLGGWAPVEAVVVDPNAGQDQAEEDEGSMWGTVWRRMGKTFGFGGDKLCDPIPKVKAGSR